MKVLMVPGKGEEGDRTTGISAVVHKYVEYLEKDHAVEFVSNHKDADLIIGHAGVTREVCDVSVIHGLYWTGDYNANRGEYKANADIVSSVRSAQEITVPSGWVQKVFQRDMHISPTVIHHGVEWEEWQGNNEHAPYILWNKNRPGDVCSPLAATRLATMFPQYDFVSTFSHGTPPKNMQVIGKIPHNQMRELVQKAGVYLSLVKETFGIGILEAMASGVPVLGWDYGGNQVLVQHQVNGYLAKINNYNDLAQGLQYCIDNFRVLGENSRIIAKQFPWNTAVDKLYEVMERALEKKNRKNTTTFIIPVYNYANSVARTIRSVCEQTEKPLEILVIDDGSSDNPESEVAKVADEYPGVRIKYVWKENGGVASARNLGVKLSKGKYICCLDADDAIAPDFLKTCTEFLENNPSVYTAYTRLLAIKPDGTQSVSEWPGEYKYDNFIKRQNQVPTCNVSRREVWERLGGQRGKYSPAGAGSEDAEMWLRAGAAGMGAKLVTEKPLFVYSWLSGIVSGNPEYREVDWLQDHPWTRDGMHPFASHATPEYLSHKVFQYDLPKVSVIIPCARGHEEYLRDALDSLEAQTLRHWEVIVVYDSKKEIDDDIKAAFPFAEYYHTDGSRGAAYARNLGASHAKSDVLFFLDADDTLLPTALEEFYREYSYNGDVIYSDYIVLAQEPDEKTAREKYGERFLSYDRRKKLARVSAKSLPYDCVRAQKQPESERSYEWTTVSVMISKELHNKIGGFDVGLKTIEDVDYHWRLSHIGSCYTRIEKPLIVINLSSGTNKKQKVSHDEAIKKISKKYEGVAMSPCGGCGKSRAVVHPTVKQAAYDTAMSSGVLKMDDSNFVLVLYTSKNIGNHPVVGAATGIEYGYRYGGQRMLVHKDDIAVSPHLFKPIEAEQHAQKDIKAPSPLEQE
jgi:glycosyltransferase involved in cell wall biosynthesis